MTPLNLKPTHKVVKNYFKEISDVSRLNFISEGAVSPAFAALLRRCAAQYNWTLIEQYPINRKGSYIRVDGALVDAFKLPHGYWEAKDTADDLEKEVKKKFQKGYPKDNILFQAPNHAIIYQNGIEVFNEDISKPEHLIEALHVFFSYQPPEYESWQRAVEEFKDRVPELATGLLKLIESERETNPRFVQAFNDFTGLCREAINRDLSIQAVEEMLIQHLLTERIFRKVFDNPEFTERNIIAREIEKVVQALTSQHFSRHEFLKSLDRFYGAIETTAASLSDYSQKQDFLNTIYERFFQGYCVKVADTHGIVYTPQPIVNFMVQSVENILQKEFNRSLGDEGVHILDPFVGTGNFIMRVMREIPKTKLESKYSKELHCNEVMLLPYYISSMNIEHEYYEMTGTYTPFEGICLVDTFELAEGKNKNLLTYIAEKNAERIKKQQDTPIFVIIGNPPYNAKQINENDNNKNRKYLVMDKRVTETYTKDSEATNKSALSDVYVKAIRFASDRVLKNKEGIVSFVTNNSFIDDKAFDGMRRHLAQDFNTIYTLDLGGNARKGLKVSDSNVFGIRPGISINFLIKKNTKKQPSNIFYMKTDEYWKKEQKFTFLNERKHCGNIIWEQIKPNKKYTWLTKGLHKEFDLFLIMGKGKNEKVKNNKIIFSNYSNGIKTNRDAWTYNFNIDKLSININSIIETYNDQVFKWARTSLDNVDDFVLNDDKKISWSEGLKKNLEQTIDIEYEEKNLRYSIYRPFTKKYLYFDKYLNERCYQMPLIFPTQNTESENLVICAGGYGRKEFSVFIANCIPDLNFYGDPQQSFPYFTYSKDGTNRRENITDWALEQFQAHYNDDHISKWDIFHYIYALLSHPKYREKYAANLKRELPRIPFAPDFWAFAKAGARLAELHVNYENQPEYKLDWTETEGEALDWRVEKMKLPKDKTRIIYNDFLTLDGIPLEVFDYKLGNRSALNWIIDQYRVKTDKRSGIVSDPNRAHDPQYIVRLIGQVITVSLETVKIVNALPGLKD